MGNIYISPDLAQQIAAQPAGCTIVTRRNADGTFKTYIDPLPSSKAEYMADHNRPFMTDYKASRWKRVGRALFGR